LSWLTAVVFLLIPAIAVVARRSAGSWLAPSAFFAAFWTVFGGLPLVAGPVQVAPTGMLFIAGSCAAVLLGAWLAQKRARIALTSRDVQEPPLLGWLIAACTVMGLIVVVVIVASINVGAGSHGGLVGLIHQLAVARNAGTWQEPAVARILTAATYLGPMLSGIMIGLRSAATGARGTNYRRWISLVVLVPSLLITAILTTRSSLLIPLALGAGAYLATAVATRSVPPLTLQRVALLVALLLVLGASFILVQMARYAGWSSGQPLAVAQLVWLDTFPYAGVFSAWFQAHAVTASLHPTLGQYTFAGFFDLLHIHSRVAGLYTDQVVINGSNYNIYTVFRGLIEDFTIPGALLFLAVVGFGAQVAYRRAQSGGLLFIGLLAAFYAFTVWSFVVNIFIYNSIVLAFAVLIGYLALATRPSFIRAAARLGRSPAT
jgi:oligosaccharide repeat unit polymerase